MVKFLVFIFIDSTNKKKENKNAKIISFKIELLINCFFKNYYMKEIVKVLNKNILS